MFESLRVIPHGQWQPRDEDDASELYSFSKSNAGSDQTMTEPVLSIIVIGRNEGSALTRCLQSLASVRGVDGETETIYVDSASEDGSPQIATNLGAAVVELHGKRLSAARGRNAGWKRARAPYLLFLDGDTVLNADFPRAALNALAADRKIAAVWGHLRELHPEHSIYNSVLDLDWIYPPGETELCGGNVLMRKTAIEEVEGYDPDIKAGEEPELCRRLRARGYRILHIDSPMAGHDLDYTRFSQYWKRATRTGYAYAELSERFRQSADPLWVRESRNNVVRGSFWIVSLAASMATLGFSRVPLALWLALLTILSLRSGWKVRWKAPGRHALLFLHGLHSQMQQIPILLGQIQYYLNRQKSEQNKVIEFTE
jgi:cellulose synthase/poly-beta-1,6-N-acetylglucosamine synthase-like glycosyltransferase